MKLNSNLTPDSLLTHYSGCPMSPSFGDMGYENLGFSSHRVPPDLPCFGDLRIHDEATLSSPTHLDAFPSAQYVTIIVTRLLYANSQSCYHRGRARPAHTAHAIAYRSAGRRTLRSQSRGSR